MKVICIDDRINARIMPSTQVKEGNIYEVTNSEKSKDGTYFYQLLEFPDEIIGTLHVEFWFEAFVFIPLSEIDELEMKLNNVTHG